MSVEFEREILAHIGLYRISEINLISKLYPGEGIADLLSTLKRKGLTKPVKLGSNRTGFGLTKKGAELASVAEDRARNYKAQALHKHLGILHWACSGPKRVRLEANEVSEFFEENPPLGDFCISGGDSVRLWNIYVPQQNAQVSSVLRRTRDSIAESRLVSAALPYIEDKRLGWMIVILGNETEKLAVEDKQRAVLEAIKRRQRGKAPLRAEAYIRVEKVIFS